MTTPAVHPAEGAPPTADLARVPEAPVRAVLALGANLGDPVAALDAAIGALGSTPGLTLTGTSPRAVTAAVGGPPGQPDFLNQVVEVSTVLSAWELLRACHRVEQSAGRTRGTRWGPRTLDVDVIVYADLSSAHPDLTLPHPRAAERAFVLVPWAWLDPQARLHGEPVAELGARAGDRDTVRPAGPEDR